MTSTSTSTSGSSACASGAATPDGEPVAAWRRRQRGVLLERRLAAGTQLEAWNRAIEGALRPLLPDAPGPVFGLYWPFKGEFAIQPLMRQLYDRGARPALPCVVSRRAPLEFRLWRPDAGMVREAYGVPVPRGTAVVVPQTLVIPLVGFDAAGYRLGYGGGYYDRTIASLASRPLLIGVGFELSRLDTIYPQPHDIPMDWIVTERGATRRHVRDRQG